MPIALLVAATLAIPLGAPRAARAQAPPHAVSEPAPKGFWANCAWLCRRARLRCQTSNAGKLLGNFCRPLSTLTGGIIPAPGCNQFGAAMELNASAPAGMAPGAVPKPPPPPPPAVAAAAKIKTERAQAQIRREAVAYLAGLDCRYYPEAEAGLIAALRADRDECVRLEAALALGTGCCCTPDVVKALAICVKGTDEDGNPCERSTRVRRAALTALQMCQACVTAAPELTPPEPPLGSTTAAGGAATVSYLAEPPRQSTADALDAERPAPATSGSLLDIWRRANQ